MISNSVVTPDLPSPTQLSSDQKKRVAEIMRATSSKKSKAERRLDIRAALFELDPYDAWEAECYVLAEYLSADSGPVDALAMDLRNDRYESLSPLRATALFANRYQQMFDSNQITWTGVGDSGLELGLENASLSSFRHMWSARQHADFLGMEYDDYILAVFTAHKAQRHDVPPMPRQMHGPMAVAVASLEKKAAELELQRYLDS